MFWVLKLCMNYISDLINRITQWTDGLTDSQRRILMSTILVVAALILGVLIYWVFFRPFVEQSEQAVTDEGQPVLKRIGFNI